MNAPLHPAIANFRWLALRWVRTAIVTSLIALVYFPAGFFPISLSPHFKNNAVLESGQLVLMQAGIAVSPPDPAWLDRLTELGEFELTLEIKPKSLSQSRAVIFSLSVDQARQDFLLSQVEHRLHLSIRTPHAAPRSVRHIYLPRVFKYPDWQRLVIKVQRSTLSVTHNGQQVWAENLPGTPFETWSGRDTLSIGNTLEFNHPWLGTIRNVHLKTGTEIINLLDDTYIATPTVYQFIRADRLERFFMPAFAGIDAGTVRDWSLNLLGFLPFGFAVVVLFNPRRIYTTATLSASALSLTIELTQLWLPWRVPSSHDLALNTLGGFIGGWIAVRIGRHLQKRRAKREASVAAITANTQQTES